ncbi:MAG: sugar phosphate isomerase/epimerase family protein [Chloroflexota bacterium]|nr:sugar phosphate isomerase/epimerase family protein [Chloroflexota bacterium]
MKVGFVSLGMGGEPLQEVLDLAVDAGCETIELNGRQGVHQGLWQEPVDYEAIGARVRARGVSVTSLGGYCDFAQPTDAGLEREVARFVDYCRVARALGIPVVRAFAGDRVEGHSLEEIYPRLVEGFRRVTAQIADWGLMIGIENHGRLINDGHRLRALLQDVDSPILGITLDTGNFCWAGHSIDEAYDFFEILAPWTVNVHVKDGAFVDGEWTLRPAGRGDIDLPAVVGLLAEEHYDGALLSEYEGDAAFHLSTLESVAYLRGLRDSLG